MGRSACKTTAPGAPVTAKLTRRVRLPGDRFGVLSLRRDALEAAATVTLGALRAETRGGVSAGARRELQPTAPRAYRPTRTMA